MPVPIIEATAVYDVVIGREVQKCDAVKINGKWFYK